MSWSDPPELEEVRAAYRNEAAYTATLRALELRLTILQARISRVTPRNTAVRVVGNNDADRDELQGLYNDIEHQRKLLDETKAEVKFLEFRLEMFKAISYRTR